MPHTDFVHLHNHTHYSLLDGASRIDDLVLQAKNYGMPALAITDHGNMFGVIEFYRKAMKAGLKPIIGSEVYIAPRDRRDKTSPHDLSDASHHLTLLVKDLDGYHNLMKLSSIGYLEGFYYRPRIDNETLAEHARGLLALSGCLKGKVPSLLRAGRKREAKRAAEEYREIFGTENFYLELQDHGIEEQKQAMDGLIELSQELHVPLVATNDCHYLRREHAQAHDVLLCIQTGKTIDQRERMKFSTDQLYFKSPQEMKQVFSHVSQAITATVEIAEQCNLMLEFGHLHLPHFPLPPDQKSLDVYLEEMSRAGLSRRYSKVTPALEEKLEFELKIIERVGYAGYFLIVHDFIDHAKKAGIAVGPGRGSVAGSLVAYALGITDLDPIAHDLLFERFLNPERVTPPDIDIDFSDRDRDRIIRYVIEKYGDENVTQIITFGTMAARAVVRDVGRVINMPYTEVDQIAKLIPMEVDMTLDLALKQVPNLRELANENPEVETLLEYAQVLEGLARHASTHAAGVVIAPSALTDYVPLFRSSKGEVTTQYDMKSLEEIGLLKMDFLGLRTLTVIEDTVKLLHQERKVQIDLSQLPLDNPQTFRLLSKGETVGVFQFESSGMRDYLRKLQPEVFEDMIAMNALYRPGPLGSAMIDDFIHRKRGRRQIEYLHPKLEPILDETYGVIVYQEQVMRIASDLAGFSLGKADVLRRAMGKKQAEIMREQREEFLSGATANGVEEPIADRIFDLMAHFAGYGFNKSHSACYALIAYQTAYLKAHYPVEFMAATLSSEMDNSDRVLTLMEECRRMGIEILPPDVNGSIDQFIVSQGKIRFGLGAVKNVGHKAICSIVQARESDGIFEDIFDFCCRIDLRMVNRRMVESLIMAGAMDNLKGHRAQQLAAVPMAIDRAQRVQEERTRGQTTLFEQANGLEGGSLHLPPVKEWSSNETLAREKEVLGFYVSGHPLMRFEEELSAFSEVNTETIQGTKDGHEVSIGGMVTKARINQDRRGKSMIFFTLEDFVGTVEVVVFSDLYGSKGNLVEPEAMILARGRVSTREGERTKLIASDLMPLAETRARLARLLNVRLSTVGLERVTLEDLKDRLEAHPGRCGVMLHLETGTGERVKIRSRWAQIEPTDELMDSLRNILGRENVWFR